MAGVATTLCRYTLPDDGATVYVGAPTKWLDDGTPCEARRLATQDMYGDRTLGSAVDPIGTLLAPVAAKTIYCVGLNYAQHAKECGRDPPPHPVVFMKAVSSVQRPLGPIELPACEAKVDYEVELAIIGRPCKDASAADALDYVLGYTVANDVSGREWQLEKGGGQWCFGKSFDTFTPLGPCLVTDVGDPQALALSTTIDGEVVQASTTGDMIFSCAEIVSFLSQSTTLLPGTVILTGTPPGVGMGRTPPRWLRPGERVTAAVARVGALTNPVA